ncbi:AraC family transcriptional regulator [Cohnella abietis]|uniref:Transcriptional regulator n=1 Tax=Cohnella abietis TaxID=2507935 RepID=A0A3T1D654_9BACL|nr:AraC family transcriptional regulator [Cohnella abietis]BBI33557.1 transcriptional regulator [Cohnella abietis]
MNSRGVAISMVYPIMKIIVNKGFDTELYCKFASFDPQLLQDVDARISAEELERLMIVAANYTQDHYFGLHQGQLMEFVDMGILGYVMLHSKTIVDALTAYQRYNAILYSGFNLEWEINGEDVLIRLFLIHSKQMSRHCVEDMASSLYQMIGKLSNRPISLHEIEFTHDAPEDTGPYMSAFGIIPKFGSKENSLRLSKDVLNFPVMYSDIKLLGVFETIAQETMRELNQNNVWSNQVVRWIKQSMPSFFPTLQQTAESFGMSTRALQYKLKEENTTYVELSTQVRKELAMGLLRKREYSVGDIAYVLHFSEPSAFQSAFKKWTGLTPGQYRSNVKGK